MNDLGTCACIKAVVRAGMHQAHMASDISEDIVLDQIDKLKTSLQALDHQTSQGKRAILFSSWDETWNGHTLEE